MYNSNVKSVLLYGCECWRMTKKDSSKLSSFHNKCLRRIYNVFWPNKISNSDLYRLTSSEDIAITVKRKRLSWVGHALRKDNDSITKMAMKWTPQGRRNRGRPKTTWRRTVISELGTTWGQAGALAKDRKLWRQHVAALCLTWDDEDK